MAEETKKKKKLPTAEKRIIQSDKRQELNHAFKSRIRTAVRTFEKATEQKASKETLSSHLNLVYKLLDKSVKNGIFKKNKAAR